jgi:hypothetical protein
VTRKILRRYAKDTRAVKPYPFDWGTKNRVPEGDTIDTSTFEIDGPAAVLPDVALTADSNSIAGRTTTVWLSAGVLGETYQVTNLITTTGGITDEGTIEIRIEDQ